MRLCGFTCLDLDKKPPAPVHVMLNPDHVVSLEQSEGYTKIYMSDGGIHINVLPLQTVTAMIEAAWNHKPQSFNGDPK